MQKSAEGIVASWNEPGVVADGGSVRRMDWRSHLERRPERLTEQSESECVVRKPSALAGLPSYRRGERVDAEGSADCSSEKLLMERIVESANMNAAYRKVKANKGVAGVDRMSVEELADFIKSHWPGIRDRLLDGSYRPEPVLRVELPKPDGGTRLLGIPTVLDRLIQQAILQVLQEDHDKSFSESSFGFRPGRSARQAIRKARDYVKEGRRWVVDLDLEKFFDKVNHDLLMSEVGKIVSDPRLLKLIRGYLKAGVMVGSKSLPTARGTPQGGPLSPFLANVLLDRFDKEMERRGHAFVRYADDCNIYVTTRRSANRVLASVTRFLERKLKLLVNKSKSAADRPWRRTFLGFTISVWNRIRVSERSWRRFKFRVRALTRRNSGWSIERVLSELNVFVRGWKGYYDVADSRDPFVECERWIRRKLRCYQLKQWGKSGYRNLRRLGVDRRIAWITSKSPHGPWRLSRTPGVNWALNNDYWRGKGLISLSALT
ncbi:group II intron reverse transcriptase/maturase [Pelagicoccus mobilis]|uniref:RNA-directed DNA polymerase n=1 Tax=Pelagicoccus mobilis TaxID=415221 RepID=A0A934VU45_9BACT|nr:group II intron reverse transcriptase/maturase [Pelagicoccus mobilis]MBK1880730.1 group II intron reverse transcriptase/maturase [Pelagicoccus mobilis]